MGFFKSRVAARDARATPEEAGTPAIISGEKDAALALVGEHAHEVDPEVEKRVVRKIDWFLIPAMTIGYGLVYWDKAILGSAVLFGMTGDLKLSITDKSTTPPTTDTSRLSWATSLFYFGMLTGLYPMTFALQRFNLGRILGAVVILWGTICMLTAAVTTHQGLYAQRFFLGFVESIIPTSFMTIISSYYTQEEQALRQSWWFSSTGWWTIIGSAINYGFAQVNGGGLKGWQYIYLFAGALTILFGLWCFAVPNSPTSAWFLTADERIVAVERLRRGQTGVRCQVIKSNQIKDALTDPKVYIISLMMAAAYTVNGAVSGFGPLIVSTFGYTSLQAILLQFPLGFFCLVTILLSGYLTARIPNVRILLLLVNCIPVFVGFCLIWKTSWTNTRPAGPVVGYSLIGSFGAVVSLIIVLGMSNVAGNTKKSVMAAGIFVAYCVGNIVGPQLVNSKQKEQHYPELWTGLIICYCICVALAVGLWWWLWRENRKREALRVNMDGTEKDKRAFEDLTDRENVWFKYVM